MQLPSCRPALNTPHHHHHHHRYAYTYDDSAFSPFLHLPCSLQNKSSEYCAPITSMDWNALDPSVLGTASIDTTCTIWDLET